MKKQVTTKVLVPILSLFLTSCASMYIPSAVNIPLLEEKHEVQLEASVSTNSVHLLGAFAITEKWALTANGSFSYYNFSNIYDIFGGKGEGNSFWIDYKDYKYAHGYGELGFGRINMIDMPRLNLELFAGVGYGAASNAHFKDEATRRNKYFLIFTQCNIGFKQILGSEKEDYRKNKYLEFGGALRLAYSHFNFSDFSFTDEVFYHTPYNNIHLEPTVFFKIGSYSTSFIIKYGGALKCNISRSGLDFYEPFTTNSHLSLGVNFRIGSGRK